MNAPLLLSLSPDFWNAATTALMHGAAVGAVLLVLACGLTLCMRRNSAAARHLVWTLALVGLLLLPAAAVIVPKWNLAVLPRELVRVNAPSKPATPALPAVQQAAVRSAHATSEAEVVDAETPNAEPAPAVDARSVFVVSPAPLVNKGLPASAWVVLAWLVGTLVFLLPLPLGMLLLHGKIRRSRPLDATSWAVSVDELRDALGLHRRVWVGITGDSDMPMAVGILRPAILLPGEIEDWPEEKRRAVLLHELAHVARRDCLTHALARIACALHWFNPLAWYALHRMRVERERACDDRVLAAGQRPSAYAQHLLEIAQGMRTSRLLAAAAISMAKRGHLEGRLLSILDAAVSRRRVSRRLAAAVALGVLALVLGLGALHPISRAAAVESKSGAARPFAVSGIVRDTTGEAIADATVVLQLKNGLVFADARTKKDGAFSIGLPDRASVVLWAAAPGCEPASADAVFDASLIFKLKTVPAVVGTVVVNRTGQPVADAHIQARLSTGKIYVHDPGIRACPLVPSATTDREGRFALHSLFAGEFYSLHASAPGFADQDVELRPNPKEPPRIVLDLEAVLSGAVVDASSSAPISGATVEYTPLYAKPGTVVADASGRFRIGNLGTDFVSLRAWTNQYVPEKLNTPKVKTLPGRETECPPVRVVPGWFARIRYVMRDTGTGVPRGMGSPRRTDVPWMEATTPIVSGSSVYGPLPAWPCHFVTHATGFCTDVSTDLVHTATASRIEDVSVVLTPHCRLWGTVVDQEGKPLSGVALTNLDSIFDNRFDYPVNPGQHPRQSITDASGAYVFMADRLNSRFRLAAAKPGYATVEKSVNGKSGEVNYVLTTGAHLSGRVVMEDGSAPSEKTTVKLLRQRRDSRGALEVEADSQGRYALAHLVPGPCFLQAQSEHCFSELAAAGEIEGASELVAKDLVLVRALRFGGKVVDEDTSKPVEGVRVMLFDPKTRDEIGSAPSGPDGAFMIEKMPPGEYNFRAQVDAAYPDVLYLFAENYSLDPRIRLFNEDVTDFVVKGRAAARVEGRVIAAETGMPVVKARVSADTIEGQSGFEDGNYRNSTSTDAAGFFSTMGRPGKRGVIITAQMDGYAPGEQEVAVVPGEVRQNVIIELKPGRSVSGLVLDGDDKPVKGAFIGGLMSRPGVNVLYNDVHAESDADGKWSTKNANPGDWKFAASTQRYSIPTNDQKITVNVTVPAEADVTGVVLHLRDNRQYDSYLKGKLVDAQGKAVAGVNMQLMPTGPGMESFNDQLHSTDKEGAFNITHIPAGRYNIWLYWSEASYQFEGVTAPQDNLVLKMEAKGGIAGRVVGPGGEVVPNFRAWLFTRPEMQSWESRESNARTFSSREGLFEYTNLSPGSYRVKVDAPGFVPRLSEPIEVPAGKTAETTLHLNGAGAVRVQVSDSAHKPVAGATVLTSEQFQQWQQTMRFGLDGNKTDAAGQFVVPGLAVGPVRIVAFHERYPMAEGQAVVQPGRTVDLAIVFGAGGVIAGHVTDAAGKPAPGVNVRVFGRTGPAPRGEPESTDADGAYRIEGLSAGRYSVSAEKTNPSGARSMLQSANADVREGETTTVDFRIGGGRVHGLVTRAGAPVGDMRISARTSGDFVVGGNNYNATTGPDGRYELVNVAPGPLTVELRSRSGSMALRKSDIVLDANQDVQLDFAVPTGVITGTVVAADDGKPLPGARVGAYTKVKVLDNEMSAQISRANTDANGRFELTDVPGGAYAVGANAEGYGFADTKVDLTDGARVDGVVVKLSAGGSIRGTVNTPSGPPADNLVFVALVPADNAPMLNPKSDMVRGGRYSLSGLAAGDYLVVTQGQQLAVAAKPVHLDTGQTVEVNFDLTPGVEIAFNITDPSGQPVDFQTAFVRPEVRTGNTRLPTFWTGDITKDGYVLRLEPGSYAITITSRLHESTTFNLNVAGDPGSRMTQNVVLTPKGAPHD